MKKLIVGIVLLLAGIAFADSESVQVEQAERVGGARMIESSSGLESVLLDVVAQPLVQSEIDLFLVDVEAVLTWAEENGALWLSAEEAENPIALIKSFRIWEQVDMSYAEFVAVVSKLMFLEELNVEEFDLADMKKEYANIQGFLASGQVPEEALSQVEAMLDDLGRMVYLVESVVPVNLPVYTKNRSQVSSYLKRLQAIEE